MTDLFKGHDLTTISDKVAESQWTKRRAAAIITEPGFEGKLPEWDGLEPPARLAFKNSLLPVIIDVLEALDDDPSQVSGTPDIKAMVEYGFAEGDRTEGHWYENQFPIQHDVSTTTFWALHLRMPAYRQPEEAEAAKNAVLERMAMLPEVTGEYTYGDSFRQWCEPSEGGADLRLCIYFTATPGRALSVGEYLAHFAWIAIDDGVIPAFNASTYAISTAGDYAAQIEVK